MYRIKLKKFVDNFMPIIEDIFPPGKWPDGELSEGIDYLLEDTEIEIAAINQRVLREGIVAVANSLSYEERKCYILAFDLNNVNLIPEVLLRGMGLYLCLLLRYDMYDYDCAAFEIGRLHDAIRKCDRNTAIWTPCQINLAFMIIFMSNVIPHHEKYNDELLRNRCNNFYSLNIDMRSCWSPIVNSLATSYGDTST